jgi:hypothetical protein
VPQDQGKFVAAQTRDDIFVVQGFPDPGRHMLQDMVADGMSEAVVQPLEVVDVHQAKDDAVFGAGVGQGLQVFQKTAPVRQSGQRIGVRQFP